MEGGTEERGRDGRERDGGRTEERDGRRTEGGTDAGEREGRTQEREGGMEGRDGRRRECGREGRGQAGGRGDGLPNTGRSLFYSSDRELDEEDYYVGNK